MKLIRHISFLLLLILANSGFSQSWTGQAYAFYQAKDFENARITIDSAITTYERFDSQTWQLRGVIYRNISGKDQIYYREIAIESFVHAKKVDTLNTETDKINNYLKSTIVRYYNDAVTLLIDFKEFEKAELSYNTYKVKYRTLIESSFNFNTFDINFYNAMASEYLAKADEAEQARKLDLRNKALANCVKVLQIDSLDYKANFNAGIIHYNTGVDYIIAMKPDITIEELIMNQSKAEEEFLKAIPYLLRALAIDPSSIEVMEALMGCYYGLNMEEEYIKYQTAVDKYYLSSYIDKFEKNPTDQENLNNLIRIYTETIPDTEKAAFYRQALNALIINE